MENQSRRVTNLASPCHCPQATQCILGWNRSCSSKGTNTNGKWFSFVYRVGTHGRVSRCVTEPDCGKPVCFGARKQQDCCCSAIFWVAFLFYWYDLLMFKACSKLVLSLTDAPSVVDHWQCVRPGPGQCPGLFVLEQESNKIAVALSYSDWPYCFTDMS